MLAGATPRDLDAYSEWREEVEPEVVEVFDFYARYLVNQTSGLTDALSLPAAVAAFQIEEVPREEWPEMTGWLLLVHSEVMKIVRREEKAKVPRG